jgi:hypothetical protein
LLNLSFWHNCNIARIENYPKKKERIHYFREWVMDCNIAIEKHHYKPKLTKKGKRDQKILLTINEHECPINYHYR